MSGAKCKDIDIRKTDAYKNGVIHANADHEHSVLHAAFVKTVNIARIGLTLKTESLRAEYDKTVARHCRTFNAEINRHVKAFDAKHDLICKKMSASLYGEKIRSAPDGDTQEHQGEGISMASEGSKNPIYFGDMVVPVNLDDEHTI